MEINKIKSDLTMKNFYFKECSIKRTGNAGEVYDGEMTADIQKNIESLGNHTYEVELTLTIDRADLSVLVIANAQFAYDAGTDDGREQNIVNNNTVAIMFPFIRSQVSLLTTQPGMIPIVLPAINTAKFR